MIPLKLQLKNFLSYGSELQTIDFGPYNLICLSGKNGHGKSALLDAMTWALWGQARKISATAKPDQGLLRLGQRQMIVIFDFLFNGNRYRVRREFTSAYGKTYAYLDFAMLNSNLDSENSLNAIALTGKTIKETQEKIESVIGLDFDSFINSAFLKQGQSNEFSKKSPKERKEILANILGLNRFEIIKKSAQEKIKVLSSEKEGLFKVSEHIENELKFLPEVNIKISEFEKIIQDLFDQENLENKNILKFEKEEKNLNEKIKNFEVLKAKLNQIKSQFNEIKNRFLDQIYNWRDTHRKYLGLKDYSKLEETQKELKKKLEEFHEKFHKTYSIKEELIKLQENFNKCKEMEEIKDNIEKLETDNKKIEKKLEKFSLNIEIKFENRKELYHTLVANGNAIKLSLKDILSKSTMISDKEKPSCPLCLQNLSISRKEYLQKQFQKDEFFALHKLERIKVTLPKIKDYLVKTHSELENIKEFNNQIKFNNSKIEDLKNSLKNYKNLSKKIVQENIDKLEDEIKKINYSEKEQKRIKDELVNVEELLFQIQNAKDQQLLQKERSKNVSELSKNLRNLKLDLITSEIEKFKNLDLEKDKLEKEEKISKSKLAEISSKKEKLLQERGNLQAQKDKLLKSEEDLKSYNKKISELDKEISDYKEIAIALGKDGIQALLIEESIPEIEQEANELLSRLTNNQSQIFIESLRDLKKGGTKETLDIKISDDIGLRPYEMFSGGEAFRIDFAIRIAISKLLARRAGTSLQTLIIDEGFGSQDEEGLNNIMDCIYKIQDDFEKIIIVSHLPSMKEQFPVQFVVNKSATGSLINVVECG